MGTAQSCSSSAVAGRRTAGEVSPPPNITIHKRSALCPPRPLYDSTTPKTRLCIPKETHDNTVDFRRPLRRHPHILPRGPTTQDPLCTPHLALLQFADCLQVTHACLD